jgi:hypothetical protein
MCFWFNNTPRCDGSIPFQLLHRYNSRLPGDEPSEGPNEDMDPGVLNGFNVGDEVFVRPPNNRCTEKWRRGTVTGINSQVQVEVDGMPRHISHVRSVPEIPENDHHEQARSIGTESIEIEYDLNQGEEPGPEEEDPPANDEPVAPRRSSRLSRPVLRFGFQEDI